jgi:hypothetical protein
MDRSFPPQARVTANVPCVGCGYDLRGAQAAGKCPECGLRVGESLWPLARPDKAAGGLRWIGNSYLGLFALLLVPFALGVAGSCAGWVGALALLATAVARANGVADLRFRAATEKLPVIGSRINLLWMAAVAEVLLAAAWVLLMLAAATNPEGGAWVKMAAVGALAAWLVAATAVAGLAGWTGAALAAMLGYWSVARRLRAQWMLVAAGPAAALGIAVLSAMLAVMGGGVIRGVMIGVVVLALGAGAVMWLIGLGLTLSCMSELARVAERARDALENVVAET